jgi:hypothetical protein
MRSIRLDERISEQLEQESLRTGESVEKIVRDAVEVRLRRYEGVPLDVLLKGSIGKFASTAAARRRTGGRTRDAVVRILKKKIRKGRF